MIHNATIRKRSTTYGNQHQSTLMSEIFASRNFRKTLHSRNFLHFAGIYFRKSVKFKYFAGIYFREFIKNCSFDRIVYYSNDIWKRKITLIYLNRSNLVVYWRNECIKEFFLIYENLKCFPKYQFFSWEFIFTNKSKRFFPRVFNFANWRPIREYCEHFWTRKFLTLK